MSYDKKLREVFPYHVDLDDSVQVALAIGYTIAAGTAFAVTYNYLTTTYRLWMSESSYRVIAQKIESHDLG